MNIENEIHIWHAHWPSFKCKTDYLSGLLTKTELEKSSRFKFALDRERSIITRGILRILLGKYLNEDPAALEIIKNSHGKPYLGKHNSLKFNISDSGNMALFGFVKDHEIGVDIEQLRSDIDIPDIAERFFSKKEAGTIKAISEPQKKSRAFFNCWSRKEAFIKAIGLGLFYGLDKFTVDAINNQGNLLLEASDDFSPSNCFLANLELGEEYAGALSVLGHGQITIKIHEVPLDLRCK